MIWWQYCDQIFLFFYAIYSLMQQFILYSVIFLDILWISLLIPASPDMITYYQTSPFWITFGLSAYSLFAFLSAPVLGQLSDRYGRKPLLLLCVIGTAMSFVVLVLTQNIWLYLISRIINGITGGNISIIQSIMSDISKTSEERMKKFGLMGMLFGLAFIIWPVVGGILINRGLLVLFWFCLIVSIAESVLIWVALHETHPDRKQVHIQRNPFVTVWKYLTHDNLKLMLWSMMLFSVGWFILNSTYSLYLTDTFWISASVSGYLLAIAGVISAINQWVLLGRFWLKRFTPNILIILMHSVSLITFLIMGIVSGSWIGFLVFLIVWFIQVPFGMLLFPIYNSTIIGHVSPDHKGEISGVLWSLQSIGMFVGPLIGWALMELSIPVTLGSAVCIAISRMLISLHGRRINKSE